MKRAPLLALAALASAPAFAVGLGPLAKSGVTDTDRKGFYLTLINPYPTATAFHAYAIGPQDETPQPLSDDYSTREVLLAAAVQGAIFGLVKTAIDRYGMKGVRRLIDTPLPSSEERAARRNGRVAVRA